MNSTHYDWTKAYRRKSRDPRTRFFKWCRRHKNEAWFLIVLAALGTIFAYLTFIGFIYLLVNDPAFQPR